MKLNVLGDNPTTILPHAFKRYQMRVFVMCLVPGLYETVINNGINCSADNEPHSGKCVCPDMENMDRVSFYECKIKLHNNPFNIIPMVKAKQLKTIPAYGCVPQLLNYSILKKTHKDLQQTAPSEGRGSKEPHLLFWFYIVWNASKENVFYVSIMYASKFKGIN